MYQEIERILNRLPGQIGCEIFYPDSASMEVILSRYIIFPHRNLQKKFIRRSATAREDVLMHC